MTLGDSLPWARPVACGGALAFFLRDFSVISAELSIRVGPVIVRHFATRSLRRSVACTSVFHTGGICVCQTRHSTGVRARGGSLKKVQGTVNLSNRPKKEILILFSIRSNGMTCAGCGFGGRRSKQIGVYRFVHCDIFHVRFGCGRGLQARMYPTWAEQRLSVADGLQILLCKSGAMVSLSTSEAHFECGMPGIEGSFPKENSRFPASKFEMSNHNPFSERTFPWDFL